MANHTFRIELDLKPTDKTLGSDLEEEQTSLQATLQRDVPWTYSSMHVPAEFARTGIGLESWSRAVEGASQLWKERTAALAAVSHTATKQSRNRFTTVLLIVIALLFLNSNGDPDIGVWFIIFGIIVLSIMLVSVNRSFIHQYMNVLAEFEQKWSFLARDLNAEYGQRGVSVKTIRKHVLKRGHKLAWTIGLGFQFRIQPVDDDEVAWCISNSQTSDVEDDVYQSRMLRVIKESQLSQVEGMSNGVHVVLGEQQSGMAVAIAVVDEVDVENSSDVGTVNEKAALLNLV
ncbi:hypothetical protein MHU86_13014 [Fragilaria crotonensis]|nr:hypothetical protein MHU86_13014 [Fragilaria crotonensis]